MIGGGRGSEDDVERLVKRCGRLPLALRVAGRFLAGHPGLSIEDYIEAVDRAAVQFAVEGEPETDVRAVLGLSAQDLARQDRALAQRWQMLAVFPDDFDRAATAAVWEVEESAAGLQLSELAARSMVIYDDASRRWRLHDLMRDVAQVPLQGENGTALEGRLEAARVRHALHYYEVLREATRLYREGGEGVLQGLARYDLEARNIQTGHSWAVANIGSSEAATRLCVEFPYAGGMVLSLRLHPLVWITWLNAQLDGSRMLGDRQRDGYALGDLGHAWLNLGEPRRAVEYYERALTIMREIGDRRAESTGLGSLGLAFRHLDEPRRAIELLEQHLVIAREVGDRQNEGTALGNLGIAWRRLGEPRPAIGYNEQQLAIAREIGDRGGEGTALYNSALALDHLGERAKAVLRAEEALAICEAIGAKRHVQTVRAQLTAWGAADGR